MEDVRKSDVVATAGDDTTRVGSTDPLTATKSTRRESSRAARSGESLDPILSQILEGALELTRADLGTVHVRDPASGALEIVAHIGFSAGLLEHLAFITDEDSAGGRAAETGTQTVIADVDLDQEFHPHGAVAATSGLRAVVATPLVDHSGSLVGIVSTYFRRPGRPEERDLRSSRIYGLLAGEALARSPGRSTSARGGDLPDDRADSRTAEPIVARHTVQALTRAAENAVNLIFSASLALEGARVAASGVRRDRLGEALDELDRAIGEIQSAAIDLPDR